MLLNLYSFFFNWFFFLNFFLSLFILKDRETEHLSGGGAERERERQRIPSRVYAAGTESDVGLELTNCEILTRAEVGRSTD